MEAGPALGQNAGPTAHRATHDAAPTLRLRDGTPAARDRGSVNRHGRLGPQDVLQCWRAGMNRNLQQVGGLSAELLGPAPDPPEHGFSDPLSGRKGDVLPYQRDRVRKLRRVGAPVEELL